VPGKEAPVEVRFYTKATYEVAVGPYLGSKYRDLVTAQMTARNDVKAATQDASRYGREAMQKIVLLRTLRFNALLEQARAAAALHDLDAARALTDAAMRLHAAPRPDNPEEADLINDAQERGAERIAKAKVAAKAAVDLQQEKYFAGLPPPEASAPVGADGTFAARVPKGIVYLFAWGSNAAWLFPLAPDQESAVLNASNQAEGILLEN